MMTKLFKKISNLWKINVENIDEDDIQSLSMLYKSTVFKFWVISIILISSCILIIVGWLTKSTSLMMLFVCISILSMFKWIELVEHKVRLHRNIVNIASNRGELPYYEVLVNLDICLGASIKLTKSAYRSYCMHWNFDTVFNNEESSKNYIWSK